MKKYEYRIEGLDCAHCAMKIQSELSKQKDFANVNVNFNTSKLSLETDVENAKDKIAEIVSKIEPEAEILELNQERKNETNTWGAVVRLLVGIILAILGCYVPMSWHLNTIITISAYVILLARTVKNAIKLFIKSKSINENLLITVSCIGAYLVGEHMEGLMVIILYEIGKILEERAVNRSRKSIKDLMNIKPEYANLKIGDKTEKVEPNSVKIGDIIVVKQGEKIPLDGKVISGNAKLDTSALTGESALRLVQENDEVLSGSINMQGLLEIEVTSVYENSTVSKILELVENATDKKAKTETFVEKAAKIYTPLVIILATLVAVFMPMIFQDVTYSESIYKALIFLVISCPCAIAISVPLSYFSGIGKASKSGILIKGSNFLDELGNINEVVFDKTGTLTTGSFNVSQINSFNKEYEEKDILDLVAKGEKFSNHPIAKSVLKKAIYEIDTSKVENFEEITGKGIKYRLNNEEYLIGSSEFVGYNQEENIENATVIYLKKQDEVIGNIVIKDEIKKEAKDVINSLNKMNITTKMFTGDNENVAKKIAEQINIKEFKSEMLPKDKYEEVEKLQKQGKHICFVGDRNK